jgi:hypothetical protein
MNQILINLAAFNMARDLLGMVANEHTDEEHRRLFEGFFKTCQAGLEACCQQDQRMQHNLRPMGESHVSAATK